MAVQVEVCVVRMGDGEQATDMKVMVGGGVFTVNVADPETALSSVEVAVIVAVPAPLGVKTPACVIAPPVAVQFTAVL